MYICIHLFFILADPLPPSSQKKFTIFKEFAAQESIILERTNQRKFRSSPTQQCGRCGRASRTQLARRGGPLLSAGRLPGFLGARRRLRRVGQFSPVLARAVLRQSAPRAVLQVWGARLGPWHPSLGLRAGLELLSLMGGG